MPLYMPQHRHADARMAQAWCAQRCKPIPKDWFSIMDSWPRKEELPGDLVDGAKLYIWIRDVVTPKAPTKGKRVTQQKMARVKAEAEGRTFHVVGKAVVPGTNTSVPWMVTCCGPNQVHLVDDCWLWCEITSGMNSFNITSPGADSSKDLGEFDFCLLQMHRPLNESNISGLHVAGAASYRASKDVSVKAATLVVFMGVFGFLL